MIVEIIEEKDELFNYKISNRKVKVREFWINEVYFYLLTILEEYKFSKIPESLWCDYDGHISLLKGNVKIKVADFLTQEQIKTLNERINDD